MALIVLPKAGDPGGAITAQVQLQLMVDFPLTVVMILYGDTPAFEVQQAVAMAVGRAAAKPSLRRVVWCPDPGVLTAAQRQNYFRKRKFAVTVGLADKVAAALALDEAQDPLEIDIAFNRAEAQTPNAG